MWQIEWTPRATDDVRSIRDYTARDNPAAASAIADRLAAAADILSDHPLIGRSIGRGVRQLSAVYPYQIRYRVRRDYVEIVTVRHGARR